MTPMGKLRQKGKCAASTPGGGSGCGPRILCIVSCFSKFPGELVIGVPPPEGPCEGVRDASPLPCSCLLPHLCLTCCLAAPWDLINRTWTVLEVSGALLETSVLLFLVLLHIPISNRSCVDFYKGQRNSVGSNH